MREETNCRHYETPSFRKGKSKPNKNQAKQRRYANLPPDLRFASRKNSKTTQKRAEPTTKNTKKPQDFPWTRRANPTCLVYGPEKGETLCNCEKQQQTCEVLLSSYTLRQPPQSSLRRAFSIFQKVDHRQKRFSLHSAEGYRNLQTSHSSVVRPMWFSELLAAVPSQEGTGLRAQTNQLPVQDGHAVFPRLAHLLHSSTTTGEAPFCAPVFCSVVRTKRVPSSSYLYVVCDKKGSLLLDCDLGKVPD